MIEREFVKQKKREYQVQEFVVSKLNNVGHSKTKMQRTPLGEKIIIYASRPGLVVGREGKNIKDLTKALQKRFKLENPQIELAEVENMNLDANIISERIASSLERFGINKFKGVGHKVMSDAINAGALGIEIIISGKVPSSRARSWRFYQGYLKKCGDIALTGVDTSYSIAKIKSGIVGIQVRLMPPETKLPDNIQIMEEKEEVVEDITSKEKGKEAIEKTEALEKDIKEDDQKSKEDKKEESSDDKDTKNKEKEKSKESKEKKAGEKSEK